MEVIVSVIGIAVVVVLGAASWILTRLTADVTRLSTEIRDLREDNKQIRSDTQAGFDSLRSETQAGFDSLRSETQAGFDSLRSELREFRGDVGQLRNDVHSLDVRMAGLPEQADA